MKVKVLFAIVLGLFSVALAAQTKAQQQKRVAIALFGPHPSLQQVVDGFKQQLAKDGIAASYDEGNVNFDRTLVPQFLQRLAAGNPDLMLTITTPMTQSARQILASRTFPIVFAPVTDPVKAKLVPSWDGGAPLLAGVSNMPDFDATLAFIHTLLPDAKRIGILFNPGDDSDASFVERLSAAVTRHGMTLTQIGVDNANDIPLRVRAAGGQTDVLFIPASSLLQPASAAIAAAANAIKLPVIGSNTFQARDHQVLASYAVDFQKVGVKAGQVAARILKGEDAAKIAIAVPEASDHTTAISGQRLRALGLSLPAALKDCGCVTE
jgi:putative ABC transport system substrate-binding protein